MLVVVLAVNGGRGERMGVGGAGRGEGLAIVTNG